MTSQPFDTAMPLVCAEDVAILIGVPLTLDEFAEDIAAKQRGEHRGDYAFQSIRNDGGDLPNIEARWQSGHGRVAALLESFITDAVKFGTLPTRIVRAATLTDLAAVSRSGAKVLMIIAHWRDAEVFDDDLSPAAVAALCRWAASAKHDDELAAFLRAENFVDDKEAARYLATRLTEKFLNDVPPDVCRHRRDAIERVGCDGVFPGFALELRDGMHKAGTCGTALHPGWSGIADLSICRSRELAIELKAGRDDRMIVTNREPKYPAQSVRELQAVLALLSSGARDYRQVRKKAFIIFRVDLWKY